MIDRKEKIWLTGFIIIVIVVTTIPYILGYGLQTPEWRFSGIFFSLTDTNSYLAKMLRGAEGDWLFRTPYTAIEQKGIIAFLPYILLGKLSSAPGQYEQLIVLFQLFRISGIALASWAIYRFISRFIKSIFLRRFGLFLAVLGGGLGWLAVAGFNQIWQSRLPLEFYSPESFGFLSFLGIPHLLFSRALLILGFEAFLFSFPNRQNITQTLMFVVPWLLLGFFQPISLVTTWVILLCFIASLSIIKRISTKNELRNHYRYIKNALWIAVITMPLLLYNTFVFRIDPVLASWMKQNLLTSPPIQDYFFAYIIILPFSIFGLVKFWKSSKENFLFFLIWIILFPILAYFPISIQRRLPEGIWIMLVATALFGIVSMSRKWKQFSVVILSLGATTSILIIIGAIQSVLAPMAPRYISSNEIESIHFLQKQEFKDEIVLAAFDQSNRLAAWTPVFLITGLGPESMNLEQVSRQINHFYQNQMTSSEELEFLKQYRINFIIYGPEERELGIWDGNIRSYLVKLFENKDYEIFSVIGN